MGTAVQNRYLILRATNKNIAGGGHHHLFWTGEEMSSGGKHHSETLV